MEVGDALEEEEGEDGDGEEEEEIVAVGDREVSGAGLRARLVAQVSAPLELAACLNEHDYI